MRWPRLEDHPKLRTIPFPINRSMIEGVNLERPRYFAGCLAWNVHFINSSGTHHVMRYKFNSSWSHNLSVFNRTPTFEMWDRKPGAEGGTCKLRFGFRGRDLVLFTYNSETYRD